MIFNLTSSTIIKRQLSPTEKTGSLRFRYRQGLSLFVKIYFNICTQQFFKNNPTEAALSLSVSIFSDKKNNKTVSLCVYNYKSWRIGKFMVIRNVNLFY